MRMRSASGQPLDADLTSLAALGTAADKGLYTTAANTWAEMDVSATGRSIIDDASTAAVLTTLGVSSTAQAILDDASNGAILTTLGVSAFAQTILDDADAATARATLGVTAGVVRYAVPVTWSRGNVEKDLTNQALATMNQTSVWAAPRAGSIVGISSNLSDSIAAGTLTINVTIDGTPIALALSAAGFGDSTTQAAGIATYVADQRIGVTVTTNGAYSPETLELDVWVYVQES